MRVLRLQLRQFRNYWQLDFAPAAGPNIFLGANAQGKSNLLEALVLLSTARSHRTSADHNLIHTSALDDPLPYAYLAANLEGGPHRQVDLVITARRENSAITTQRAARLDGKRCRLLDVLGALPTVLFTPEDLSLLTGPPALRRRYLDLLLCQVSPAYSRALATYNKALLHRNSLLRLLKQRRGDREQLHFYDKLLAEHGATLVAHRAGAVAEMSPAATKLHAQMAAGDELSLSYMPALPSWDGRANPQLLEATLLGSLQSLWAQDIERGSTSLGPHRDDLRLQLNGQPATAFASRGQLRTAALSLRLTEAWYMEGKLGREPVLLLDDVMSELDQSRRLALEEILRQKEQSFLTALEESVFSPGFLASAALYAICAGELKPYLRRGAAVPEPPRDEGPAPA
jgi:DNA replication and repair protein RecF